MTKARTLADFIADGSPLADGTISVSEVSGAAPLASPSFTGDISVTGTVDGRDVAADGTKLDTVETNADVTDATNVQAAGALMDSELSNVAAVKALDQGVSTTDDPTFTNAQLAAISSTIADTAVDIFVYDTRKDSDGGAWRKRTQHTSWYNETLNTATRGSRKEFPAVAVIVAESNQVTIYDGDDPDLPMWYVFNNTSGNGTFLSAWTNSSVAMLNGVMYVGQQLAATWVNFVQDTSGQDRTAGRRIYLGSIAELETTDYGFTAYDASYTIVNAVVNDVAMTVLPNAPIDAATGLPVPTIAVATDGGVSVIKDDGTVVDSSDVNSYSSIDISDDYRLISGRSNTTRFFISAPLDSITSDGWDPFEFAYMAENGGYPRILNGDVSDNFSKGKDAYVRGGSKSLMLWNVTENDVDAADDFYTTSLACNITSDYNTGWMHGDIKLATLSDTDDTNVTGSELVTNGTFDSDTSGWSAGGGATLSVVSNALRVTNTGTANPMANQTITGLTVGATYTVYAEIKTISVGNARVDLDHGGVDGNGNVVTATNSPLSGSYTFTANSSSAVIQLYSLTGAASTGAYAEFDNISVRLAEEDRSVNGNGLQVFGTVTKSAVATGADLVAYSGFSASNYLLQPYNSDLAIGTGDYTCVVWMKKDTLGLYNDIFDFSDRSNTNRWEWLINSGGGLYVYIAGNSVVSGNGHFTTGVWNCVAMTRRNGVVTHYINGKSVYSGTAAGIIGNTGCDLYVGVNYNGGNANGELSLLRISQTAASAEQIRKIYEDEKVLFQEGAQATLYGSSDAVTALAYDDSTELLHVGTSAGRSVFQGLRRVDNTTTAVGAAISASNGLVADE